MSAEGTRAQALLALRQGKGWAGEILAELTPEERDQVLLEAANAPAESSLVEDRTGAFLARQALAHATPRFAAEALKRVEGELAGTEAGHRILGVLCEMAACGYPFPPLPFLRLAGRDDELLWRLPVIRTLAAPRDPELLSMLVDATADGLEDPFDAKDWGEALALARPEAEVYLRSLLGDPRPMVRLGAAFALASTDGEGLEPEVIALETLADLLAFDPDPVVRVHALEIREDVDEPDRYRVVPRTVSDPGLHPYMDGWHWTFAAQSLEPEDLPEVLKALDASDHVSAAEIAEILEESAHPLAVPLLRSRLFTHDEDDRVAYLDALESRGVEPDAEVLALFPRDNPPPRVLMLRAQAGDEHALDLLFDGLVSGHLPPDMLVLERDELLISALVPRALAALPGADLARRCRLLRIFRHRIPPERRPAPDPSGFESADAEVLRETALDHMVRARPEDLDLIAGLLHGEVAELQAPLIDALRDAPATVAAALAPRLLDAPSPAVRRAGLRSLAEHGDDAARGEGLRRMLDDADGWVRADALRECRMLGLSLAPSSVASMLADAHDEIRGEAVRYLAQRYGTRALPALRAAAQHERTGWVRALLEDEVRRLARHAARTGLPE